MYPNLYYVFKDWFGVEWHSLSFLNTFGLMVAVAFLVAAWVLTAELKRKEKLGLLLPKEETIEVGKPAGIIELLTNGLLGFIFGYKVGGIFLSKSTEISPQEYIFSSQGNVLTGLALGAFLLYLKWSEKNKQKLAVPEKRIIRVWPHDRVGDIIVLGLIFGILGAKLFDNLEHWDEFWESPIQHLLSQSGLTFYGGLILATIAILIYAYQKRIKLKHLMDAAAPALMIAYAIGRIGCHVSGDGDWGIYNSAYVNDANGKVMVAKPGNFEQMLDRDSTYFLKGFFVEGNNQIYVTDRIYPSLKDVPHKSVKGPSFLPTFLFANNYAQNVNKDGEKMQNITDEHNRVLPSPVFPTPLYETIICSFIFLIMWLNRKKIKTPYFMFGLYLLLNGTERYLIEMMRVNIRYKYQLTQAEIIALALIGTGVLFMLLAKKLNPKPEINS